MLNYKQIPLDFKKPEVGADQKRKPKLGLFMPVLIKKNQLEPGGAPAAGLPPPCPLPCPLPWPPPCPSAPPAPAPPLPFPLFPIVRCGLQKN